MPPPLSPTSLLVRLPPSPLPPPPQVASHLAIVTHASVSGGSGPAAATAADDGGQIPNVRALVLPRAPGVPGVAAAQLRWACGAAPAQQGAVSGLVDLEEGAGHPAVVEVEGDVARSGTGTGNGTAGGGDAGVLYLGVLGGHVAVGCGARLWVQVSGGGRGEWVAAGFSKSGVVVAWV